MDQYLSNKAGLLAHTLIKHKPETININLAVRDSLISSSVYGIEEIKEIGKSYSDNPDFLTLSEIVFKEFNLNEYWNLEMAIKTLDEVESNENIGFSSFFELLYEISDKNLSIDNRRKSRTLLVEGFKLVNSAGMRNFWNQNEVIDSEELSRDLNKIFAVLNFEPISRRDSIVFEQGKHIITFD